MEIVLWQHVKFSAYIVSILIVLLAVQPAIDLLCHIGDQQTGTCKMHCGSNSQNETPQEAPDCSGQLCNPLLSCGSCAFVLKINTGVQVLQAVFEIPAAAYFQLAFSFDFAADCWQPPKFV